MPIFLACFPDNDKTGYSALHSLSILYQVLSYHTHCFIKKGISDLYAFLGNCPPTPPLSEFLTYSTTCKYLSGLNK